MLIDKSLRSDQMNRADRKREERESKKLNNTYLYNEKQVNDIMASKKVELTQELVTKVFGVIMISMRDEFGWFSSEKHGTKRINRFIDRFNENMTFVNNDDTKLEDYNEWCRENNILYEVKRMSEGA